MRSNPDQTLAAARESMRHPRPSATIRRHHQAERPFAYIPVYPNVTADTDTPLHHLNGEPYTVDGPARGPFLTEMRAMVAVSSPQEIAAAIRDMFTDADQAEIIRLIMDGES